MPNLTRSQRQLASGRWLRTLCRLFQRRCRVAAAYVLYCIPGFYDLPGKCKKKERKKEQNGMIRRPAVRAAVPRYDFQLLAEAPQKIVVCLLGCSIQQALLNVANGPHGQARWAKPLPPNFDFFALLVKSIHQVMKKWSDNSHTTQGPRSKTALGRSRALRKHVPPLRGDRTAVPPLRLRIFTRWYVAATS